MGGRCRSRYDRAYLGEWIVLLGVGVMGVTLGLLAVAWVVRATQAGG